MIMQPTILGDDGPILIGTGNYKKCRHTSVVSEDGLSFTLALLADLRWDSSLSESSLKV